MNAQSKIQALAHYPAEAALAHIANLTASYEAMRDSGAFQNTAEMDDVLSSFEDALDAMSVAVGGFCS